MPSSHLLTFGYVLLPPFLILPNGRKETLSPKERLLFSLLSSAPAAPFSRESICLALDLPYAKCSRKVDALVMRLRKKMGRYGASIVSLYGKGYAFVPVSAPKKKEKP